MNGRRATSASLGLMQTHLKITDRVRRLVRHWLTSGLGADWVVAVSGGSDSVGLLRVLHALAPELKLRLSVAHLNHGARGDEAKRDAEFVERLAESLRLPFDLGHWRADGSSHFESEARKARYAWLAEIARTRGASVVAVGHTRDDQAETILHRIVRGTGLRGLAGIPARRPLDDGVTLVRPLLTASRAELRAYLAELHQPFREDATNADRSRTRARLRHDLLPRLAAEYNPKVADALVRLGQLASASERAFQRRLLEMERVATLSADHDRVIMFRDPLLMIPRFLRAEVLRLAWRRAGWPEGGMDAKRWRRLAALVKTRRGRTSVGAGVEVSGDSLTVILERQGTPARTNRWPIPEAAIPLELPGAVEWLGGRIVTTLDPEAPRDETVDLDRLVAPLWVRAPVPGDRFEPLGMGGKSTPLNDFFRGRRVSRDQRARTPLVCDGVGIVWVVGHRIAQRVRLTDTTRRTLGLRWVAATLA